jgi:Mrp family chromosome partitioning ATPase
MSTFIDPMSVNPAVKDALVVKTNGSMPQPRASSMELANRHAPDELSAASPEQVPAEFVHLQTSIESHFLDKETPSELALNAMAEEGLSQDKPYVLGVTSAIEGEGKTTTALHLALAMAQNSFKRICLMDFSLDSDGIGDIGDRLGLYPSTADEIDSATGEARADGKPRPCGIIDILEERATALSSFQMAEPDNLTVVPAGRGARRPARIARSPRVRQIIASAKHAFDVIIVDLPAVSTENALPLARHMDGIMIVVHSGATPREVVQRSIDVLGRERVVGVALNRHTNHIPEWLSRLLHLN